MLPGFISGGFFGATVSELLNTGTVSGGAITFTGLDLSPYYEVRIYLSGIEVNADDNKVAVQLEIGGSLVTSASYQGVNGFRSSNNSVNVTGDAAANYILVSSGTFGAAVGVAAGESLSGWLDLGNFYGSKNKSVYSHVSYREDGGESVYCFAGGLLLDTGNVTGLKIYCPDGGGSLTAGRAFLMGLS